jgi:hypothetical protein
MRCPICSSHQTFQDPTQGLERRRFPKGRWVCEYETQPWHLQLETAQRELAICSSEIVKNVLLFEITRLEQEICSHGSALANNLDAKFEKTVVGQTPVSAPKKNASQNKSILGFPVQEFFNDIENATPHHLSRSA